jgi:Domain of unknown function (DUF4389)
MGGEDRRRCAVARSRLATARVLEDAGAVSTPRTHEVETAHPVVVEGDLAEPLSQWLGLVKWLLLIPHFIVLVFLWIAFFVVTVIAFFAILLTGRYPRGLFGFNVDVLRWTWRVAFYGYSALGTDRDPPWWGWWRDGRGWSAGAGLISVLVLFAAVVPLFKKRYPRGIFDLVMGLNRWTYRVVAYAARMRRVPAVRLDQGPREHEAPSPTSQAGWPDSTITS